MDREAKHAAVHGVIKSRPWLNWTELMIVLFLVFWENFIVFFIVSEPIYIQNINIQRFIFLHILSIIYL